MNIVFHEEATKKLETCGVVVDLKNAKNVPYSP